MADSPLGPLHHVGVAVRDIKAAAAQFEALLGADVESDIIHDPLQGVRAQFLTIGGLRIELLEPAADPSPLDSVLKRGVALYHTCHEVADLDATLARLTASGVKVVSPPKPAIAFANRRVAFIICQGMIIELLEEGTKGPGD